jgi:hypothetical protein
VKRQLYDKYTKNIDKLLDLACGKGGDLDKWVSNNIGHVIGYDINEKSIIEANRRVNEYRFPKKTKVELYVKDLSRNVIEGNGDCDVVTSMFAFHYFFESKDTFDTIMRSIDNNLKHGGYFIGTMFDGNSIKNILQNSFYTVKDGDDIKFNIEAYKPLNDNPFGNKIGVYLKDTVLDEPMDEYVVYFDKFVDIMKSRGYELEESKMFEDIDLDKSRLNNVEKSVSYLNRYFVFKRISSSLCKQEYAYLTECEWPQDILEIKRVRIVNKYKKALDNKIIKASPKAKMDYIYLRDNFDKGEQIINDTTIDVNIRNYYKKIYDMFLDDLKK